MDMERTTWVDKLEALLKRFKYLRAKDKETGSSTSRMVFSSFFSDSFPFIVMLPPPISPATENLMDSLEVSMVTKMTSDPETIAN